MARKNINQSDITRQTGLAPNTVTAICTGKDTRVSTLKTFADALDLTLAELFTPASDTPRGSGVNQ